MLSNNVEDLDKSYLLYSSFSSCSPSHTSGTISDSDVQCPTGCVLGQFEVYLMERIDSVSCRVHVRASVDHWRRA